MIDVEFIRIAIPMVCAGCEETIERFAPAYLIDLGKDRHFVLCEDCGNYLQNDMSDEYHEFVDMGK